MEEPVELDNMSLKLPPVTPSVKESLHQLIDVENLPLLHKLEENVMLPDFKNHGGMVLREFDSTAVPLTLNGTWDFSNGKIIGVHTTEVNTTDETPKTSYSLTREPAPPSESVRGNSTNLPFLPGGMELKDSSIENQNKIVRADTEEMLFQLLFDTDRLSTIPGSDFKFTRLVEADEKNSKLVSNTPKIKKDLTEVQLDFWQGQRNFDPADEKRYINKELRKERNLNNFLKELKDTKPKSENVPIEEMLLEVQNDDNENEEKGSVLKISDSKTSTILNKMEWAEEVDISKPVSDFTDKVNDLAFKFPFELDVFQKQAIIKLEDHQNVFVAAHTSAGKTVVAEYAIALSVRHMTRAIYTSPIKALSNQKFRDFRQNFESVGLVTGDVQINQNAACLIMTTEILRSMLYNGSDVIRDLEWVIFDEIHYLNNEERGHVWEEVLIMLPQHVSIIMLSATVPNALQFANWVGGIKKKKIYVISTLKRPVPLEHHLYTGSGGKSKSEQFLILGADGKFLRRGWDAANSAITDRMSKYAKSFGPKSGQKNTFSDSSERNTYIGLINHLKETDKLPVVIFTFSRNRCDNYASLLESVDLCTAAQKGEIHGFFQKSISKLTGTDKQLPQVLAFQEMLKRGIGVHHSGILPLLKEVVEMLFQRGLVKLLFATETFAMGVNMPARTVVFDSVRKHDGYEFRALNAAEYIQMAGRAGRRGLDTTGTVIIMCKQGVPDYNDIHQMMLGSAAKLESKFRLTYSMILNLLRIETITVEDVMKRSFLEAGKFTSLDDIKKKRQSLQEKVESMKGRDCNHQYFNFYEEAKSTFNVRDDMMGNLVMDTKKILELLKTGRLMLVELLPKYTPRLGIIINSKASSKAEKIFQVLILTSEADKIEKYGFILNEENDEDLWGSSSKELFSRFFHRLMYYSHTRDIEFVPEIGPYNYPPHAVIEIAPVNILDVYNTSLRIEPENAMNDIKRREMERFRDAKPYPNLLEAVYNLYEIHNNALNGLPSPDKVNLFGLAPMKRHDLKVSVDVYLSFASNIKQKNIFEGKSEEQAAREFYDTFRYMKFVEELEKMDFSISPNSLQLHDEYQQRIEVLRRMGFIDNDNLVLLKGRVACEMGNQNELMMTELLLNNIIQDCSAEEIAALFSCMVFEAKRIPEPELAKDAEHLAQKVEEFKKQAFQIGEIQRQCNLKEPVQQFVEQFKFGLVEVVFEWAKGKPFAEIMKLTEVQEGLIVRTIQRLDEMIRDVKDAARIIGDPTLKVKMEEASVSIKRDIVFAASLYTE